MGKIDNFFHGIRLREDDTLDIGFDTGTPVTEAYEMPFVFTGKLDEVAIDLK
jgi:hypothetical protein